MSFPLQLVVGDDEDEAISCTIIPCNNWEDRLRVLFDEDSLIELNQGTW